MNKNDITELVYGIVDLVERSEEAANYWGERTPMMAVEELGELVQAISKMERKDSIEHRNNLKEEIRDVFISLGMLMNHYSKSSNMNTLEDYEKNKDKILWSDVMAEEIVNKLEEKKVE